MWEKIWLITDFTSLCDTIFSAFSLKFRFCWFLFANSHIIFQDLFKGLHYFNIVPFRKKRRSLGD